jgi:hypothetical protein
MGFNPRLKAEYFAVAALGYRINIGRPEYSRWSEICPEGEGPQAVWEYIFF